MRLSALFLKQALNFSYLSLYLGSKNGRMWRHTTFILFTTATSRWSFYR